MGEAVVKTTKAWMLPVFLVFLSIVAITLSAAPVRECITGFISLPPAEKLNEIIQIAALTVIMSLCRSLPVPTRKAEGYDISSIALFATFLSKGMGVTIIVLVISAFFTFDRDEKSRKVLHIFNTSVAKTLFNNFNLILSVILGAMAFELLYHSPAAGGSRFPYYDLTLPGILLPSLMYLAVSVLSDSICMGLLFWSMRGTSFTQTFFAGLRTMAPTMFALSPIGYFIAFIFSTKDNGPYMALLFFIPLLFARYAFKLYLDSKEQFIRTISTLTAAIEAKDKYTEGHSKRVADYSVALAQEMKLHNARIENIKVAAVLHDIGKIGIDDEILRKPTKLSPEEWDKIVQHPSIGIKILEEVAMPSPIKEMIHYHHIRFDRTGYPSAGRDKPLPIEVHIISLADAYDAMTSDRPYRNAMSEDMAVEIIKQENGTQFHPDVVEAFLKLRKRK